MALRLTSSAGMSATRAYIAPKIRTTPKVHNIRAKYSSRSITLSQTSAMKAASSHRRTTAKRALGSHRKPLVVASDDLLAKDPTTMTFPEKVAAAFRIFFPPPQTAGARVEAKKRLRMILVADRCNMTPGSMEEMKRSIVEAVSDYVEVDDDNPVDLDVSTDPDMGTVYSVQVPVRRVRDEYGDLVQESDIELTLEDFEEKEPRKK